MTSTLQLSGASRAVGAADLSATSDPRSPAGGRWIPRPVDLLGSRRRVVLCSHWKDSPAVAVDINDVERIASFRFISLNTSRVRCAIVVDIDHSGAELRLLDVGVPAPDAVVGSCLTGRAQGIWVIDPVTLSSSSPRPGRYLRWVTALLTRYLGGDVNFAGGRSRNPWYDPAAEARRLQNTSRAARSDAGGISQPSLSLPAEDRYTRWNPQGRRSLGDLVTELHRTVTQRSQQDGALSLEPTWEEISAVARVVTTRPRRPDLFHSKGQRNQAVFDAARFEAYRGLRGQQLLRWALSYNAQHCRPALGEAEVAGIVASIERYMTRCEKYGWSAVDGGIGDSDVAQAYQEHQSRRGTAGGRSRSRRKRAAALRNLIRANRVRVQRAHRRWEHIVKLTTAGYSISRIAALLGCSTRTVSRARAAWHAGRIWVVPASDTCQPSGEGAYPRQSPHRCSTPRTPHRSTRVAPLHPLGQPPEPCPHRPAPLWQPPRPRRTTLRWPSRR